MVWMPRNIGFDGNEIADYLARQGSSHPLTEPEIAFGISIMVARGLTRSWVSRENKGNCSPFVDKGRLRVFLKDPLLNKLGNYST
jgi:hypothetical protein